MTDEESWARRTVARGRELSGQAIRFAEGTILDDLVVQVRRTRVIDLSYTIAAQAFVAMLPLILVITGLFVGSGDDDALANQLVNRFGLAGAAGDAVRSLFRTPGSGSGVYWLGLLITLYSAFALSRRVSRAYTTIWGVHPLPVTNQWRGLVWIVLQVVALLVASSVRTLGHTRGLAVELLALGGLIIVWGVAEYAAQWLLTAGQVARDRLLVAAGLVSLGRVLVLVWSSLYLPGTLSRQALQYGPIGVVFGLFTWLFAVAATLVLGTLLAAVLTSRTPREWFAVRLPVTGNGASVDAVPPA